MKINEFIVVEGRDDTERVKSAVECDTIETNGSAINKETLAVIQNAQETRGVIVLTDPDFPGDKIRHTITEHVSGVKHAYLDREKAKNKRGKIGVEHAHPKDIRDALMHVSSPFEEAEESIDKSVLIDLGLIIGKDARRKKRNTRVVNYTSDIQMASNCLRNSMHLVILNRMCAKRYLWKRRVNKRWREKILRHLQELRHC